MKKFYILKHNFMKEDTNMSKQKIVTVNPDGTRNEQEETTMNNYYDENETQANDIQDEASANEPETTPEEQQATETPKKFGWKEFIIGGLVGVPTGIALTCTWFALKGKKGVPAPKLDNVVDIATKLVEEKAKEA